MTLIHRIARLFRADLHAVLDRIEEPDLTLRQAVRDMEEALAQDRQRLRNLQEEQGRREARRTELEARRARLQEELDLCFQSQREDLARGIIRRRLEIQRTLEALSRDWEANRQASERLSARIAENAGRLEAMRQKAESLTGADFGESPPQTAGEAMPPVTEDEVEIAFLQEQRRRQSP